MSLELDARQRAMLAEMGLRLFEAPRVAGAEAAGAASAQATASGAPASPARRPAPADSLRQQPVARAVPPAPNAEPAAVDIPFQPASSPEPGRAAVAVERMDWDALADAVAGCRACRLCESRRNTVFGSGDRQADWLVVGDAPGEQEDLQGEPFAGQDGRLLDNMLGALGLERERGVYIANVLKCRPPGNRNPEPDEVAQCESFLRRQVALLQPKVIVAMGRFAIQSLLGSSEPVGRLRGRVHRYLDVPVVVTYPPAYLLRNLPDKAKAWADLCLAQEQVERAGG